MEMVILCAKKISHNRKWKMTAWRPYQISDQTQKWTCRCLLEVTNPWKFQIKWPNENGNTAHNQNFTQTCKNGHLLAILEFGTSVNLLNWSGHWGHSERSSPTLAGWQCAMPFPLLGTHQRLVSGQALTLVTPEAHLTTHFVGCHAVMQWGLCGHLRLLAQDFWNVGICQQYRTEICLWCN